MLTNTFGKLVEPQSVTLDAFRVEELLVNPVTNLVRVRLSAGIDKNDGAYTPVTSAGTFDLTQDGLSPEVSETVSNLLQQLTDLVQAELLNQNRTEESQTIPVLTTEQVGI